MSVQKVVGFALLGLVLAGCGQSIAPSVARPAATKAFARSLAGFTDLQGNAVSLSQLQGHPVVLSFLSPAQGDSQAQLPHLIRLAAAYQGEGVVFVVGGEAPAVSDLAKFASDNELTFPVWFDRDGAELRQHGFTGLPAHEFLRGDGTIATRHHGFMSRGELLEAIARIQP